MKPLYSYLFAICTVLFLSTTASAQFTEDFEGLTDGDDSFMLDGKTFTSSNADFDVTTFANAGAGGSDKFMDNLGITTTGASYSITTGGAAFTLQSIDMYVSEIATGDTPTAGQSVLFEGKLAGGTVWSYTKTSGFPTDFSVNEGFFELDFSTEPGTDLSIENIDELVITLQGTLQYVALDDFIIDSEILGTDPPEVQSISVVGTPNSTAPSVDFLVTFNEEAVNVDLSDFVLDNVGTTGNLASISGSVNMYTITVDGISGEGTISIDLDAANDIEDTSGNSPSPAFTAGEDHVVTRCFQETFESFIDGDFVFASNGVAFNSGATNAFSIEFFAGGGSSGSDQCLSNDDDLGTGKIYSVATTGGETFNVEAADFYASSDGGANPTDDGTLTLRGKLLGVDQFTITKSTGFPTDFTGNNGWFTVDFATDGAADFSLTNIDELEIEIGGAFTYIGLDNFEHCEGVSPADPPIVQSIQLVGDPEANADMVDFTVIFNENANNVSTDDFALTLTGTATGSVNSVSGSGNTYTVTVDGISGEGSLRLDLLPGTDIADDSANTPPDPFTEGEVHLVSSCFVETFEALALDANTWTRAGVPFTTSTTMFSVDEFIGAGAGNSDRYLDNIDDQGVNKVYSISVSNSSLIFMESFEVFLSSEANGANPTNDGSLTVRGLLDGVEQYTFTLTGSFPTIFGATNGFSTVDFATDGPADYTGVDVDEVEVTTTGAFVYIGIDNFKFCEDIVAPIAVCQDVSKDLNAMGMAWVAPTEADGGSSDNSARFFLGFEQTTGDFVTDAGSLTDEYFPGDIYFIDDATFTVPVTGTYTPASLGNTSTANLTVMIIYDSEPVNRDDQALFDRPEFVAFSTFDDNGDFSGGATSYDFVAGQIYYMDVIDAFPTVFGEFNVGFDMPIYSTQDLKFDCTDIGTINETLYAFDEAGNIDSCSTDITINGRSTTWNGVSWDNGAPDLGALATFSGAYNTSTNGGSIDACTCDILSTGGSIIVAAGDYLNVFEDINMGGALIVQHEGSVVQIDEGAVTTNTGILSVQKTTPDLALRDFMIVGSPLTIQNSVGVFDNSRLRTFDHTTANFVPNTDVATAFPSAENFADDNGDNWNGFMGTLNPGEGYLVRRRGTDPGPSGIFTFAFTQGTLTSGPVNQTAVFNGTQNASPNIVANPYASAIDANIFINQNTPIVSTLYFWEHLTPPLPTYPGYAANNYDMGDISMYTIGSGGVAAANGGTPPTQFISSGQGFGYKAAIGGTVTFNNAMRVTGPNDAFRALEPVAKDRIWLNVHNETYGLGSQTLIAFVDEATEAVEPHYDAKRLATPVSIYSNLETGEELGINGLPSWEEDVEVMLGFSTMIKAEAVFRISIADMEYNLMPDDVEVFLIDHVLNTQTNLMETDYTFRANEGTFAQRFSLVFQERTLDVDDNQITSVGLYPNPASDMVTISTPAGTQIEEVTIFDIRGRKVMTLQFDDQQYSFNVADLETAVYLLQIKTDSGVFTSRLIKE